MPKITVIGAGSAVFSLTIIRDICLTPALSGCDVCLMDISPDRLDAAYTLCVRYADELNVPLAITRTLRREEALAGADFVINTAACGHEMLAEGWAIAQRHGYRFGGSLHIMHDEAFWANHYQLSLIESVYEDMRRICPDAWYVLVSNPVLAGITMLRRKYPDAKMVGLCQGSTAILRVLDALGMDRSKAQYEVSGLNHFIWLTRLTYDGRNGFEALDEYCAAHSASDSGGDTVNSFLSPKAIDLYRTFGAFPLGDTFSAGGGSWAYWYHDDEQTERIYREDPAAAWSAYFRKCAEKVRTIRDTAYDLNARLTEAFPPVKSDEITMQFIEALCGGGEAVLPVNILNDKKYLAGVPDDFEVEVFARCSSAGVEPLPAAPLSRAITAHLVRDRIAPVEIELEAYRTGNRALLVDLIMMDPWTKSRAQAQALLDDIMKMPWASGLKAHYAD